MFQDTLDLTVAGYQSIRRPVTIHVAGLTVLTGSSNTGKTAMLRAFLGLLDGQLGLAFQSTGLDETTVTATVSHDEQTHTASWERTKSGTTYTIDGKIHAKAGRDRPDLSVLGFLETVSGGKTYRPQWSRQLRGDEPFLVRDSPAAAADLLTPGTEHAVVRRATALASQAAQEKEGEAVILAKWLGADRAREARLRPHRAPLEAQKSVVESTRKIYETNHTILTTCDRLAEDYRNAVVREARYTINETLPEPIILEAPAKERLVRTWSRTLKRSETLIPPVPKTLPTPETPPRQVLVDAWRANQALNAALDRQSGELETEIVLVRGEIRELLQALGRCPLCGEVA